MNKITINKKTIGLVILIVFAIVFRWYVDRVVEKEVIMGDQVIELNVHLYTSMAREDLEDGTTIIYLINEGKVKNQEIRKPDSLRIFNRFEYRNDEWIKRTSVYRNNKIESILPKETGVIP